MRPLVAKIKPVNGFAHYFHVGLVLLYPLALFVLVRTHFTQLALIIVLLSKWRMFAVRPRFWLANIRSNAVDIIVGLSVLAFMTHTSSAGWQFGWTIAYVLWLLAIKPGTQVLYSSLQAFIGFVAGLMALYVSWPEAPLYGLVLATGVLCYVVARHFFDNFDEPYAPLLAYIWGYFGASLGWVLGHWLTFYFNGLVAQPTLLLVIIGSGLGALYYLQRLDRLTTALKRQLIIGTVLVTLAIVIFADWGGKIV